MDNQNLRNLYSQRSILQQLYELTGGPKCYKGFIIAYCTEEGTPIIHTNCESQITESGLIKSMENYINEYSQNIFEEELD